MKDFLVQSDGNTSGWLFSTKGFESVFGIDRAQVLHCMDSELVQPVRGRGVYVRIKYLFEFKDACKIVLYSRLQEIGFKRRVATKIVRNVDFSLDEESKFVLLEPEIGVVIEKSAIIEYIVTWVEDWRNSKEGKP